MTQKQISVADIDVKKFNLFNDNTLNSNQNYIYVHKLNSDPGGQAV